MELTQKSVVKECVDTDVTNDLDEMNYNDVLKHDVTNNFDEMNYNDVLKHDVTSDFDELNYNDILKHIGQFGRWQREIFFWACFASLASGLLTVLFVFTAFDPNYRCRIPQCENAG